MADEQNNQKKGAGESFELGGFLKKDSAAKESGTSDTPATSTSSVSNEAVDKDAGSPASEKGGAAAAGKEFFFEEEGARAGFIFILKAVFRTFFKKFWIFSGITLLNAILVGAAIFASFPLMLMLAAGGNPAVMAAVPAGIFIITGLISFFFYGTLAGQANSAYNDLEIKVWQSFKQTVKNTGRALALVFRIFVFSGVWMIIVLMLLSAVTYAVLGGLGTEMMGNLTGGIAENLKIDPEKILEEIPSFNNIIETAGASENRLVAQGVLINPSESPSELAVAASVNAAVTPVSSNQMFFIVASFVFGAAGIAVLILALVRLVYASMAFPVLMASPDHSSKEVLERSREITRRKWWLIVSFTTIFPMVLALPGAVFNLLNIFVFRGDATFSLISTVFSAALALAAYPLTVIFYQVLAQELANPARRLKLNTGMLLLTLLIYCLPLLMAGGAALMTRNLWGSQAFLEAQFGKDSPTYFNPDDFSLTNSSMILQEEENQPQAKQKVKRM